MAFETAHSSSTASQSSSTGTGGNDKNNNFFAGGSPPLILAFLAIGLFTAAMIAVFGWRRTSWAQGDRTAAGSERRKEEFWEKPKLWDLRAARTPRGRGNEVGWDNIVPLSAAMITSDTLLSIKNDIPIRTANTPMNIPLRHLRQQLSRHHKADDEGDAIADAQALNTRLQVATVITLPSPRNLTSPSMTDELSTLRAHVPSTDVHEEHRRLEYSIGLFETPWCKQEK